MTSAAAKNKLTDLLSEYRRSKQPLEVEFRSFVTLPGYPERATHLLHPYPAKLLAHIPYFLIRAYTRPADSVVDPFCGTGTVLLEAALAGRTCYGADSNPLARLIARVKTNPLSPELLRSALKSLCGSPLPRSHRRAVIESIPLANPLHWYNKSRLAQLQHLTVRIAKIEQRCVREFFGICLAVCARDVSNADPRIAVPVLLRADKYELQSPLGQRAVARMRWLNRCDVLKHFERVSEKNIKRMESMWDSIRHRLPSIRVVDDARGDLKIEAADLVLTSPPYVAAQKYLRFSKLGLAWAGQIDPDCARVDPEAIIGREFFPKAEASQFMPTGIAGADELLVRVHRENPMRAYIASTYLVEMIKAMENAVRRLASTGKLVLIVADTRVLGQRFPTTDYLARIVEQYGLSKELELIDGIRGRTLLTKRNGMGPVVANEHVVVFS